MTCSTNTCGVGGWGGPLPGDPDNNSVLTATPAFGGVDVSWTYPTTNPFAVAYTKLYRGLSPVFETAVLLNDVGGSFYYDKTTTSNPIQYYYWIQFVSVNGTLGEVIGPATAMAKPPIATVIEQLTGQIDAGLLAQSLRTDIDKITLNYAELQAEIAARVASNNAYSTALSAVQNDATQALTLVYQEITNRQDGDSALVGQVNTIAALNATNAAAIITETNARVSADSAMASQITSLFSASGTNAAAITTETNARTAADTALANQITTAQTTLSGNIASVQTTLQTNINTVDGKVTAIGARYTATVTVNGLVGGFGIYNNGTTIEAGFDVDTFWVGKTGTDKKKPFIITGGVVYLNQAVIAAASIDIAKINTATIVSLSALNANMGTVTAGKMQSVDGKFIIDLSNKYIRIEV